MGTAQASGVAMVVAARRGIPVALHTPSEVKASVSGSGRADKAQVGAMVTRLLRLDERPPARRRDRRARAGHLPHLARWRPGEDRRGAGRVGKGAADDRVRPGHGRRRVARLGRRRGGRRGPAAALHARHHRHPQDPAPRRGCPPAWWSARTPSPCSASSTTTRSPCSSSSRPRAASGPSWPRRCSRCSRPDELRRAVAAEDVKSLTRVPGVGQKGAQRIILELKDRIGAAGVPAAGRPTRPAPGPDDWRTQVHAGLVGLGWSTREADQAVETVAPDADPATPDVAALLRAALRSLSTS